jgi:hypothetical protein
MSRYLSAIASKILSIYPHTFGANLADSGKPLPGTAASPYKIRADQGASFL